MNSRDKFARPFAFGTKARTLEQLGELITTARVLPIEIFTVGSWQSDPDAVMAKAEARFGATRLIVRSSCRREDLQSSSGAGRYASVLDIKGASELRQAVTTVIASYDDSSPEDEVFVQPMAAGVRISGVAMTCDPDSGLPYFVVNYTDGSDTAGVTAGGTDVRAFTAYKHGADRWPERLSGLLPLLRELEAITACAALDVEFAIADDGPILFQVRPMTAVRAQDGSSHEPAFLHSTLMAEQARLSEFASALRSDSDAAGALFGIMPDWNPAEMIGVKPRPLAFSLYKELITNINWSSARFRYGYRDMRHRQLMYQFCGTPYICIPHSIESFIPATLPSDTAQSIVTTCCDFLAGNRHLHDKIEFAVVPTCYTPLLECGDSPFETVLHRLSERQRNLYIAELKHLTEHIISSDGPFFNDLKLLPRIQQRTDALRESPNTGLHTFRQALFTSKVVGEIFSGAARAAFIATAILKSVEQLGRVAPGFTDVLVAGVHTIGKQVADDFKTMSKADFLRRHGHIRPGTYDIRVHRYDEKSDAYFDWNTDVVMPGVADSRPAVARSDLISLTDTFRECDLDVSTDHFLHFAVTAIAARERVKYMYSALVSEALRGLCHWGTERALSRDDLSFLTLRDLERQSEEAEPAWAETISANRESWAATRNVRAPEILCEPSDLLRHASTAAHPSFISRRIAEANVCVLQLSDAQTVDPSGKIVLIENADPGFDWIFTRGISGFITAYGGENSHMSIRAREFGVPAAIGVGNAMFRTLCNVRRVVLDCADQRIQVLQ